MEENSQRMKGLLDDTITKKERPFNAKDMLKRFASLNLKIENIQYEGKIIQLYSSRL